MKVKNNDICPKFYIGEEVKRCYVQSMPWLGVRYYSVESGIQQLLWSEKEELSE